MARRTRPFLLLLLALASGGLAAFLALRYIRERATPLIAAEPPKAQVVVAARAMPVGALVGERDIKLLQWAGPAAPAGYVTSTEGVLGRGLIVPVAENEPILETKLAAKGAGGGLPVIIDEGMRAVSVAVDQVIGVAGFVLPNTRVDVLLTMSETPQNKEPATKVLMQNIRTLAAGQSIQEDKEGKAMTVPVVTLLVSPEQAETLALASSQGRIQLALRNALDTVFQKTPGTRVSALMGMVKAPTRRAVIRTGTATISPTVVEVYRGGVRTLQRF